MTAPCQDTANSAGWAPDTLKIENKGVWWVACHCVLRVQVVPLLAELYQKSALNFGNCAAPLDPNCAGKSGHNITAMV